MEYDCNNVQRVLQQIPTRIEVGCHGQTALYVILLIRTTIGTVSFPFYHLPFPRVLYNHVFGSMTRLLPCTSMTFYLGDSYLYYDSIRFYVVLFCSFPRTRIVGLPASERRFKALVLYKQTPVKTKNTILVFLESSSFSSHLCSQSFLSSTSSLVQSGRRALLLDPYLPFDLSSTWRGVSQVSHFPPFGPKSGQMLDERYTGF